MEGVFHKVLGVLVSSELSLHLVIDIYIFLLLSVVLFG